MKINAEVFLINLNQKKLKGRVFLVSGNELSLINYVENSIVNAMVQCSNKSKKLNIPGVIFGSHYIAKEVFDKFGFLV